MLINTAKYLDKNLNNSSNVEQAYYNVSGGRLKSNRFIGNMTRVPTGVVIVDKSGLF